MEEGTRQIPVGKDGKLPPSERFKNYAAGLATILPLFGTAVISVYGAFLKGEPKAEMAYEELVVTVNKMKVDFAVQKAFVEGFLEGRDLFEGLAQRDEIAAVAGADAEASDGSFQVADFGEAVAESVEVIGVIEPGLDGGLALADGDGV